MVEGEAYLKGFSALVREENSIHLSLFPGSVTGVHKDFFFKDRIKTDVVVHASYFRDGEVEAGGSQV